MLRIWVRVVLWQAILQSRLQVWKDALSDLRVSVFDGTLTLKERKVVISRCINQEVDVLLLSLSAGGVGLNLAEAYSDMVFIDCPNSLVDFWQGYGKHL